MINTSSPSTLSSLYKNGLIVITLCLAAILGSQGKLPILLLLGSLYGLFILFRAPYLGIIALLIAAIYIPIDISTGTDVTLNVTTLLIPTLFSLWVVIALRQHRPIFPKHPTTLPLQLFIFSNLLSLIIGNATWDVTVPYPNHFWLVQLAQWSLFLFSALIFWLIPAIIKTPQQLTRLIDVILIAGGIVAIDFVFGRNWLNPITTITKIRTPFWLVLTALSGAQLLFTPLSWYRRLWMLTILCTIFFYTFFTQRDVVSNWIGILAVIITLISSRWPKSIYFALPITSIFLITGILTSTIWNFAGGDKEWQGSGGSRLVLIQRVLEVTQRNPITGLGPAAYRIYARTRPLLYGNANWLEPMVSAHNNYVDLYSHGGIIGLIFFCWFIISMIILALRLRFKHRSDHFASYINAALALLVGSLIIMFFADWILPFVYNIGFLGFQASVLVWLFWGGLVAIETKWN